MKETFYQIAFVIISLLIVGSAVAVLFFKNLLHAAVALFFCLTGVAALYILLGADYLGMAQLLIYAGGILVLIIFGIFLTSNIYNKNNEMLERKHYWLFGLGVAVLVFMTLNSILTNVKWNIKPVIHHNASIEKVGDLLLTKYLLPFELISILLLFAMIGSVLLVKKEMTDKEL